MCDIPSNIYWFVLGSLLSTLKVNTQYEYTVTIVRRHTTFIFKPGKGQFDNNN